MYQSHLRCNSIAHQSVFHLDSALRVPVSRSIKAYADCITVTSTGSLQGWGHMLDNFLPKASAMRHQCKQVSTVPRTVG